MYIQKAKIEDLDKIMGIYRIAQDYMIESGNPNQWGHTYPSEDLVKGDIENEVCYLIFDDDSFHGVFALFDGIEPTYEYIENGKWLNDDGYVTVHRIASDGKVHGIFNCAIRSCKSKYENIRIDTHKDNFVMQKALQKLGFKPCGTVNLENGEERIAYQVMK